MTTADRIKFAREKIGMSQEELAKKLGLKSRSSIARIEKSGDDVTLKDVERLSDILGCSIPYLMGWDEGDSSVDGKDVTENFAKYADIIRQYEKLNDHDRALVDNLIETLSKE